MAERLQKLLAAAGLCSRRMAEEWISAGRVCVNGAPATLGDRADPETDTITVDGQALPADTRRVYLMLNKPRGYVTTLSPMNTDGTRRRSWCPAAAHGCTPWDGWIGIPRDCCCSPTTAISPTGCCTPVIRWTRSIW